MKRRSWFIVSLFIAFVSHAVVFAQEPGEKIFVLGDSITQGSYSTAYTNTKPFICYLQNPMPAAMFVGPVKSEQCSVPNAGYPGATTAEIVNKTDEWTDDAQGSTVLVHLGTNDVYSNVPVETSIEHLTTIISTLKSQGATRIILSQIIPFRNAQYDVGPLNAAIALLAQEMGVDLADAGIGFTSTMLIDLVHPTDEGARVMARNFAAAIAAGPSQSSPPNPTRQQAVTPNRPSGTEREFVIETIPGNTALVVDADTTAPYYVPGRSILTKIQRYVSIFASLGKSVAVTNYEKQARLFNALPALLPATLQPRISYPQDHLEGNELYPTIGGRACSAHKETDPEGKILKTAIVGKTFERDFYETMSFATVFSALTGTIRYEENGKIQSGLTGLNLVSPRQDIAAKQDNTFFLTNPAILYPCGPEESQGRRVPQKPLETFGTLEPGASQQDKLNVTATVPEDKLSFARYLQDLFFAGKCALSPECRELGLSLATNATLTVAAPGYVALAGLTYDTKGDLAPNLERDNPLAYKRLMSYKGWTNTFRPAKFTFAGRLTQEDGTTKQEITGFAQASPVQETLNLKNLPWRGSHGVVRATNIVTDCVVMPKALQEARGYECGNLPVNTSDWAIAGHSANPISPDFTTPADDTPMQQAIISASGDVGIPQCVLESVAYIEGGYSWNGNQTQCIPNQCSATGPFQITVGVDDAGDQRCSACQSDWVQQYGCPDAWPTNWPFPASDPNPCNITESARVAAQKLKTDGRLVRDNPHDQKEGILEAGYRYYGSRAPVPRLGGCSYGEFLYKRCNAEYTCTGQGG